MERITRILAVLSVTASFVRATNSSNPIVNLGYASYIGNYNSTSDTNEWLGIRYAQAPIGELRFREPQDIELKNDYSSSQPINATTTPATCVQGKPAWLGEQSGSESPTSSDEDCLVLNVLAPANANASSNLAVMVQIHGGGYTIGSAESSPGNALVHQSNGTLVYVSIQYRLGAYGFLAGAEVTENGARNVGLLDQRAALMWVQRHIRNFGGDPSKVTIIGGSAGGGSVMNQMILYGGVYNPPFRAAMAEYPWWQPFRNESMLEKQYRGLLNAASCSDIDCLRRLPADKLEKATTSTYKTAYAEGHYSYGDFYYGPSVDGEVIRQLPSQEFKQGHFTRVPLLLNHDAYEGYMFTNQSLSSVEEEKSGVRELFPNSRDSFVSRLFELYPASDFNSTVFQRSKWYGDFIINCPTYYMATAVSDYGNPVYKFVFAAGNELHGAVGPFVESLNLKGDASNTTLSSILRDYYVSFAVALDPNAKSYSSISRPYWPTYMNDKNGPFSILDVTYTTIGAERDIDASPRCDFFHAQSYVVRN
ncbi:Carboxylesterase family [Aspergillus sclerotialis]|uniref:Carboxylic ester hydrolase n=1 Tax=Aspergillus sclerotialis TaxID=2070753 RepID=A0A3A2ZP45_9EURO|nr:Carboxylesterase family [Aspergillus sclerotialis]